jgi:hypothetical protein
LSSASQTINVKNYPQVNVDHLTAGQSNDTFNIGFVQGMNKSLEQKSKWVDGRCPPDYYDKPEPTVGAHPIPTATPTVVSTPKPTVGAKPSPTPKKPVTLPTRTVPTTFPKLPATGSNPYVSVLP